MINENSQEYDPKIGNEAKNQATNENRDKAIKVPVKSRVDEAETMRLMADWGLEERKPREDKPEISTDRSIKPTVEPVAQMTEKDYYEAFFKIPIENASKGRSVYIRPEFHQKFLKLIAGLEINKLTIYAYVDNIIERHFKEFDELIQKIYQDRNRPIF
ncbi:DUF3408 domain-containing protein [Chryseobacterium camelliae]|uniref:DUF3408 domain-containing protein n=1 Tax=Chryseobacterium camelliae TaxID=1265445 RepID=A0ABY7QSZ8_9FLAO|nr:DUF3408 domain-containing protein [Chryseobacterium camelliae]WBV62067.1 DUF3408 domain-containing protein [Chryseobacterium camelliae]